jgi:uncharacterized protein (DUF433 family)
MSSTVEIGSLIESSPDIHGGRPRIAGTEVTVERIVGWPQLGLTPNEIVDVLTALEAGTIKASDQAQLDFPTSQQRTLFSYNVAATSIGCTRNFFAKVGPMPASSFANKPSSPSASSRDGSLPSPRPFRPAICAAVLNS